MTDNVRDPFEDIDSENEDLEKPPTPEIHHGGDSPDAPGFSDISDNEHEETTVGEGPLKESEGVEEMVGAGSPVPMGKAEKEDTSKESKLDQPQGSPLYDQEISPVSSIAEGVEGDEISSEKVGGETTVTDKESISMASNNRTETTTELKDSTKEHNIKDKHDFSEQPGITEKAAENIDEAEGQTVENSNEPGDTSERIQRISSGAGTDDELEMPISPLGLGLSGTESDIVDDILKSDVSNLLPDIQQDAKGETIDQRAGDEEEAKEEKTVGEQQVEQDEDGSEPDEEAGEQLIADIFGASDEEEEFVGFGQEDIEVTKKKKGARDRKQHSGSLGSEADDEEAKGSQDNDLEKMTVPKPKGANEEDGDSEDDLEDRSVFVSDFDLMIQKKKEMNRTFRRKRKNVDIINDSDDAIARMISQMKEASEEDRMLNGEKQAATKKLKMLPSVLKHLHKADLQMTFLDLGVLNVLKEWISPLPDSSLPHLQIREGLLKVLSEFPPMDGRALKMSGIGKAVMYLCRHPKETRENKKIAGKLINDWARPIFGVTSNFKSLSREEREERDYQNMSKKRRLSSVDSDGGKTPKSIDSALQNEKKAVRPGDKGFVMRARVPMPSNKDYVVRPQSALERMDFNKKPQKSMNRYEKQKRKFDDKKKLLNQGSQRAVGISLEGRKMAL
ncbi:protein IWS1 homolog [Montipora foliosa]|uniref:protein IWS1 homolog n=1 Tax=Montipora foliosa TaxID=591990 RepID=UPI0035F21763